MGPGSIDYLMPMSISIIKEAQVLIGGKRHLETFKELQVKKIEIKNNLVEISEFIQKNYQIANIVILVSGDPGFHSLLSYLQKKIPAVPMEVVPGISSMQLAFCRLSLAWQDAQLISLHGKKIDMLNKYFKEEKLGLLTDETNTPQAIANYFIKKHVLDRMFYVCENLSYADEQISRFTAEQLAIETKEIKNCVVIVWNA